MRIHYTHTVYTNENTKTKRMHSRPFCLHINALIGVNDMFGIIWSYADHMLIILAYDKYQMIYNFLQNKNVIDSHH